MEYIADQAELERLAEDVLTERQLIVDLDRRRNENRMALRALTHGNMKSEKKADFFAGGLFMKLPKDDAAALLQKDQKAIDAEIERLRDSIKSRTRELELKEKGNLDRMKGYQLKGIKKNEMNTIARHPTVD
ncbi:hypothetical protein DFS34DRAFT_644282 [Phlyctochytrium arcticum]|nr:hypothetical protein DFS34DRAFT_644282 [Phlyctochytrium arcticum]